MDVLIFTAVAPFRSTRCRAAAPALTVRGLRQLDAQQGRATLVLSLAAASGTVGAVLAVAAARHVAAPQWWLPSLVTWAVTLATAAVCDARTQRLPTRLLWEGGSLTTMLILLAGLVTRDWRALIVSLIACTAASLILSLCWRFAGAGFGDVRLATVGGLGLGHVTQRGLTVAVVVFALLTAGQAIWTYARTRDRRARFAYGPALVVGFLFAAAV
jgi:leader peptidase (prepilin peptidase) / N-methyltransferase